MKRPALKFEVHYEFSCTKCGKANDDRVKVQAADKLRAFRLAHNETRCSQCTALLNSRQSMTTTITEAQLIQLHIPFAASSSASCLVLTRRAKKSPPGEGQSPAGLLKALSISWNLLRNYSNGILLLQIALVKLIHSEQLDPSRKNPAGHWKVWRDSQKRSLDYFALQRMLNPTVPRYEMPVWSVLYVIPNHRRLERSTNCVPCGLNCRHVAQVRS